MAASVLTTPNPVWTRNPLVRFFSSLYTGITLLVLILIYACVFSALPQVRGAIEVTEMRAFAHWLFFALNILLCVSVIVATLSRIRFSLTNLGVWIVHAGILTLSGGAMWYFGSKIEGDIILRSPSIELLAQGMGPSTRPLAKLLAEPGQRWATNMPAFGGEVSLEVIEAQHGPATSVDRATVRVQLGSAAPVDIQLAPDGRDAVAVNERLWLRLVTYPAERTFYDHEAAALWYRPVGSDDWKTSSLEGLPFFRERFTDAGYEIVDRNGDVVVSKRTTPAMKLGGLVIPTGWFEPWRLPVRPETDLPFDVEITGYLPYIAGTRDVAVGGGDKLNPAINLRVVIPGTNQGIQRALFALRPVESVVDLQTPFEFRWVESEAERAALLAPLAGPDELTIEVTDPPLKKTIAIRTGDTVELEGTPYKLTIQQLMPNWPLISPGFEGAASPAALVEVTAPEKHFTRTVIQRFPQFSQDIDEQGMRRKVGLYDENIQLRYRSAARGHVLLLADAQSAASGTLRLAVFDEQGQVDVRPIRVGAFERITLRGTPVGVAVNDFFERGQGGAMPVVEPLATRRPNLAARAASTIRVTLTGRGPLAGWSETHWMNFSQYPHVDPMSLIVRPPGGTPYELVYSRMPHDLGAVLIPQKLTVNFFPGRRSVESWRSFFLAQPDGQPQPEQATVYTNRTCSVGPWTLFQSGAAQDHWSYTILGVGNRNGIWPMVLGCTMITVGCLYAFYVKPVLKRRAIERTRAEEARRRAASGPAKTPSPVRSDEREVVHAS